MTTVDEFLAELQAAGLADKTLNELKKKKLHELEKEVERLRAENAELRDAGGDLHFLHPTMGGPSLVAASKRWQAAVGTGALNGGELQRLQRENAALRKSVATMSCNHKDIGLPDCRICDPRAKPGAGT